MGREAPADFFASYLVSTRRFDGEPTPKAVFPGVALVTSCESLRNPALWIPRLSLQF